MKHTIYMQENITTAATAHDLQHPPTKTQINSNMTSKRGRSNTVAIQDMNMEIPPSEGKIKYFDQIITLQNVVQVEF